MSDDLHAFAVQAGMFQCTLEHDEPCDWTLELPLYFDLAAVVNEALAHAAQCHLIHDHVL